MNEIDQLPRELRFAWLLRDDVRAMFHPTDPHWKANLDIWWLLNGSKDYPSAARRVEALHCSRLSEVVIAASSAMPFPVTLLMHYIWRNREDISTRFDLNNTTDTEDFVKWFYVCGVPEHNLFDIITHTSIASLLSPTTPHNQHALLTLNYLALYTWQSLAHLQNEFDIAIPNDVIRFLGWYYFEGIENLGHAPYWAHRPPRWLLDRNPPGHDLTNACVLAWLWMHPEANIEALKAPDKRGEIARWWTQNPDHAACLGKLLSQKTLVRKANRTHGAPERRHQTIMTKPRPFGVNIVGFARGELGIGEDSRMAALALRQAGVPFSVVNIACGQNTRQNDRTLDAFLNDEAPYAVNLFCLTGMDTARVWLESGSGLFEDRYNIGYWPWELPEWPAEWRDAYNIVDEIWASSNYTKESYLRSSDIPVHLMPMAVHLGPFPQHVRHDFGLPKTDFLFLYAFDFNSYLARKNPWAAIRAFRKAFPKGTERVRLVLKTMNTQLQSPLWQTFAHEASHDNRILLLNATLERQHVTGLFSVCDAYISPHRAEGFGRTLAEAMLLGKPVIATNYSGNTDFLNESTGYPVDYDITPVQPGEYPYGAGMHWADPDIEHLAWRMLEVVNNRKEVANRTAHAFKAISTRNNFQTIGAGYRERISQILHKLHRKFNR